MNIFNHVNEILPIEMKAEMIDGKRYYLFREEQSVPEGAGKEIPW